jgi:hypothetical protein
MPTPPKFLEGKRADGGVTNIRERHTMHSREVVAHLALEADGGDEAGPGHGVLPGLVTVIRVAVGVDHVGVEQHYDVN